MLENTWQSEIICSQPPASAQPEATWDFKRSMRKGRALQQPGNVGNLVAEQTVIYAFLLHKSFSIWLFGVDNEKCSCLQPLSEQLREAKIQI